MNLEKKLSYLFLGKESTLFVIFIQCSESLRRLSDAIHQKTIAIERCLREKLTLIPDTKLLITDHFLTFAKKENILSETLEVYLSKEDELTTLLDLLTKRLETLDLISVMQELQRTFSVDDRTRGMLRRCSGVRMRENLWCSEASEDGTILVDKPESSSMRHSLSYIPTSGFYPGYLRGRSFPPKNIVIITVYKLLYRKNHPETRRDQFT